MSDEWKCPFCSNEIENGAVTYGINGRNNMMFFCCEECRDGFVALGERAWNAYNSGISPIKATTGSEEE